MAAEPSSQYPWFRDKPAKASCQNWLAALNPAPTKIVLGIITGEMSQMIQTGAVKVVRYCKQIKIFYQAKRSDRSAGWHGIFV